MLVACASTACIARAAMRMFKRRYYRSNSIRKAIAQFTANLIFFPPQTPVMTPVASLTAMNALIVSLSNSNPPQLPLRKGGQGGFSRYVASAFDLVIPRNDSSIVMVDAKLRTASPKFLLSTGIPVD